MSGGTGTELSEQVARRAAERAVGRREATYRDEVRRIVDQTLDLIERTAELHPSLRQILAATGLSTQGFYRYFASKDELFLVLLDDGRRRLEDYLTAKMARAEDPPEQIRAWIEGVLAQAAEPRAAARTRPFVVDEGYLAQRFPSEHSASIGRLTVLLHPPIAALVPGAAPDQLGQCAAGVYDLTFGALRRALATPQSVAGAETEQLVEFALALVGAVSVDDQRRSVNGGQQGGPHGL